jgi:phage terminase large subunit-like protein
MRVNIWRFDSGLLLRLTFRAPNLTVEHGSRQEQLAVRYSPFRQELQGAMILHPGNALFKDDWSIIHDVREDLIEQVTVDVDPSGGGDEAGVVACALLNDGTVCGPCGPDHDR